MVSVAKFLFAEACFDKLKYVPSKILDFLSRDAADEQFRPGEV